MYNNDIDWIHGNRSGYMRCQGYQWLWNDNRTIQLSIAKSRFMMNDFLIIGGRQTSKFIIIASRENQNEYTIINGTSAIQSVNIDLNSNPGMVNITLTANITIGSSCFVTIIGILPA